MWGRMTGAEFRRTSGHAKRQAMESLVASGAVPGILAYLDGEPAGSKKPAS